MQQYQLFLKHYGVKGMKWGVRKKYETVSRSVVRGTYSVAAKLNPREMEYRLRKLTNDPKNENTKFLADTTQKLSDQSGVLPTNPKALKAIESMGIARHAQTKYNNLDDKDISRLKTYTDSARFSRSVNGYLAIGDPKTHAQEAANLKATLSKNKIDDLTVYRSCSLKFSVNGVAKKLDKHGDEELQKMFNQMSKNFNGKQLKENRVWSTSTSPLFAIDTWRAVNPTAASTYNTYMIIKCKGTPGVLADGTTSTGKSLVNTRSNQEAILAPNKLTYRKLEFDAERQMYAITVEAS
ncbi:MAG: hypothetical protein K9L62_02175 [Vallitaleaceae bacterium]|nr:hypothetical protein [Vallitaleaceae bacterium]